MPEKLTREQRNAARRLDYRRRQVGKLVDVLGLGETTVLTEEQAATLTQLGKENIVEISYGSRLKDGQFIDENVISILVVRKTLPEEVSPDFLAERLVRTHLGRIRLGIDVMQVGRPRLH